MTTRFLNAATGRTIMLTLVAAALGCGACGPTANTGPSVELPSEEGRRYASAVCSAIKACGCAQPTESQSACESGYQTRFDKLLEAGYRVTSGCFDEWLQQIETDPCLELSDASGNTYPCTPVRGTKDEGATCDRKSGLVLGVDECEDGLSCLDARCVETPATNQVPWKELADGAACGPSYLGFCRGDDLYCDPVRDVCTKRVPLGSECFDGGCEACVDTTDITLYCQGASAAVPGTCAAASQQGEACDPVDVLDCGACGGEASWCDPATATCVSGRPPRLCRLTHE